MTGKRLRDSGVCSECGYREDLRKDGTLGKHHLWSGYGYVGVCPGTGKPPKPENSQSSP